MPRLLVAFVTVSAAAVAFLSLQGIIEPRVSTAVAFEEVEEEQLLALPLFTTVAGGTSFFNEASTTSATTRAAVAPVQQPAAQPPMKMRQARGSNARPVRLSIPSVTIDTSIINVGINSAGEMDVPDGGTMNVGWYKRGTLPGDVGSAVLDAHVYAAFKDLRYVKVGDDIFVTNAAGEKLHFVVEDSRVFTLGELDPAYLFDRNDQRRLTLITCAGTFTPSMNTYTHRLVVSAVFAGVVSE